MAQVNLKLEEYQALLAVVYSAQAYLDYDPDEQYLMAKSMRALLCEKLQNFDNIVKKENKL